MIRFFALLLALLGAINAHAGTPPNAKGTEYGVDLRAFKRLGDNTLMAEIKRRKELLSLRYQQESLGVYRRLFENLKGGVFYWHERGNRWNEDWVNPGSGWQWSDTNHRDEHSLVLDLTPGYEVPNLPMTIEWKNRLVTNWTRGMHFLRTRPGLNYFFFRGEAPVANLFLQHEWYLPLDYGRHSIYERWLYVGALFHLHRNFQMGPYYSRRTRHWSNEDLFTQRTGQGYFTEQVSNFLGLTLNFSF